MTRTALRVAPVLLLMLGLAPPGRAAAPCTVPGTHSTIQGAVSDPTCTPITVAAGTFEENLEIGRSLEIVGAGASATTIDGPGGSVVVIDSGTPFTVAVRGLTVTGGGGGGVNGGGFRVLGAEHSLTLTDVAVTGNTQTNLGGGIFLDDGSSLAMHGGSVTGNGASDLGGGIAQMDGSVALDAVHVNGNSTGNQGGGLAVQGPLHMTGGSVDRNEAGSEAGLFVNGGDVTIEGTSISGNHATTSSGAALLGGDSILLRDVVADGNSAGASTGGLSVSGTSVTIEDTAITNNLVEQGSPGGLRIDGVGSSPSLRMTNSTVSGNSSGEDVGGVEVVDGVFVGTNLTITNNTADTESGPNPGDGGGIVATSSGAILRNSILSGNHDRSPGAEAPDCAGPIVSGGNNIVGTTQGCGYTAGPGDQIGVDPKLGPLADNGGNTLTHALLKGSPAINAADPAFAPPTDQRGLPRNPDIGAYELVFCKKVVVNQVGTAGGDTITGGNEADGVLALGGNDTVTTGGGNDAVCAGDGNDKVKGGGGRDQLLGEAGKDKLDGGGGKDRINGGQGKDACNGGSGKDKGKCEKERKI